MDKKNNKWQPYNLEKLFKAGLCDVVSTFSINISFKKKCLLNKKREILKEIQKIFFIEEQKWEKNFFVGYLIRGGMFSKDFYESIKYRLRNYIKEESESNIKEFHIALHDTVHPYALKVPKGLNKHISRIFSSKQDGWTKDKSHKGIERFGDFIWTESWDGFGGARLDKKEMNSGSKIQN